MTYQSIINISNQIRFVLNTSREVNLTAQNANLAARRAGNVRGFQAISTELKLFSQGLTNSMSEIASDILGYLSWLWESFVPHFGGNDTTFISLPDEGMEINLHGLTLQAVPAHYLHSSGNFQLYDPAAKILFRSDVGAAMVPYEEVRLFVENFDKHIRYAEGFHRRWMGSNSAKLDWCDRIANMDVDMLCPQHGSIYQGKDVERFINWFAELPVGSGIKMGKFEGIENVA